MMAPPLKFRDAITSRIKIMAKLDIAEKRLPQDGRIKIRFNDNGHRKDIDFRVSCLPTLFGEKIVMRLLDKGQADARHDEARLRAGVAGAVRDGHPEAMGHGAGHRARPAAARPTRSTRRLPRINTPETNIMTAEDPVEFNLLGINQVQIRESIGLNFAAALRSFLRQDPNIILVGEIRDFETAEIAVKAALTGPPRALDAAHQRRAEHGEPADEHGHRAVPGGQLGQPDLRAAPGAPRLQELQRAEPDSAASARCRSASPRKRRSKSCPIEGQGCDRCNGTGYKGRVGLYEVMDVTDELRELILVGASALELRRKAIEEGMITLRQSGLRKIKDGDDDRSKKSCAKRSDS